MTMLSRNSRVDLRLSAENKKLLEQAAAAEEQTVSSFVLSAALKEAREVVESSGRLRLSNRDRDTFLALLDNPPPPNDRLHRAAKRYAQSIRR